VHDAPRVPRVQLRVLPQHAPYRVGVGLLLYLYIYIGAAMRRAAVAVGSEWGGRQRLQGQRSEG
jgi:hypothetical protein